MAGRGAPSFLKRQKEQKRLARAQAKREARQARRENRAAGITPDEGFDEAASVNPADQEPGTEGTPTDQE